MECVHEARNRCRSVSSLFDGSATVEYRHRLHCLQQSYERYHQFYDHGYASRYEEQLSWLNQSQISVVNCNSHSFCRVHVLSVFPFDEEGVTSV